MQLMAAEQAKDATANAKRAASDRASQTETAISLLEKEQSKTESALKVAKAAAESVSMEVESAVVKLPVC